MSMKKIDDILKNCNLVTIRGNNNTLDGKLVFDSREVEEGDLFIAVRGTMSDGHQYIKDAISQGAHYIVCEELPAETAEHVTFILVVDSRDALAVIASNYFRNPSNELKLIGVTGTNGKTTIATLLYELTESLGYKAGLLSTIQVRYPGSIETATHTTPDPIRINRILRNMIEQGVEYVFMEVSSHAIHQKRILGLKFRGGIFTNITHEHLDYHSTFRDYIFTKKVFFDQLSSDAFALVNRDDRNGKLMLQMVL